MQRFAQLFHDLDQTNSVNIKVAALAQYFREAAPDAALWAIALLSGRRPRRAMTATQLRMLAAEAAGLPDWLIEETYFVVGDLAETIALVLPPPSQQDDRSLPAWMQLLATLPTLDDAARAQHIRDAWASLPADARLVFNKLITGGFRVGVSQKLVTRALAAATGVTQSDLAVRLMGNWTPDTTTFDRLILTDDPTANLSRPYPFYLAYQLEDPPETLGDLDEWQVEYKWDGIRAQLIRRAGQHHVWSRGEDLMTDRFPELASALNTIPDGTVLDGELLAWKGSAPLPFADLQKRLGRKTVPRKLLTEAPVILRCYDLLEWQGRDLRSAPLSQRRALLEVALSELQFDANIDISPLVTARRWSDLSALLNDARSQRAEGLMLKRRASPYRAGRKKGDWWKWKVDPLVIDGVMLYAQAGHGRRANLFTDYTFAVWDGPSLVPFTKAYSGLTDAEFRSLTAWVRKNTLERFGPVRRVEPQQVFEIAFEGIQNSPRHKSGIALRFPRMARWRQDKPASEANTLADLQALLAAYG
ncbi:ATP-dependent DNA ligase [Pseudoruegeria sp. SK021]|uniref:ATP-dependent DNA ligase n=1 Tax=Pseudoruegeria sp. SK021 TaxID=1933035 RepID=UPI000A252499|nr:ATP-dependent DNA ligase [Pseudoruegeria sp. SK021]OSP56214.1 ATP-dependent DNA ligase [Pseudoruegeria sp. SK021]